jgi:predicted nucleotidyltransferase
VVKLKDIRAVSSRIAQRFQPQKIVLFGSHARGLASEDSDVDLLVVMPYRGSGARMAAKILNQVRPDIPVELLVRTPQQLRRRIAQNDFFLREILDEGKVLYAATGGPRQRENHESAKARKELRIQAVAAQRWPNLA